MRQLLVPDDAPVTIDLPGANVVYRSAWLDPDLARHYFLHIRDNMDWQQPIIRMFGKRVASPRLACWCADKGTNYRYSGLSHEGQGWETTLAELRDRVTDTTGFEFNSCLLNYYRDGQDAMGWHSDDEPELGPEPIIASVSLGAIRDFHFRSRRPVQQSFAVTEGPELKRGNTGHTAKIPLDDGSLLLMTGKTQQTYKHAIHRSRRVSEPRINLTFRRIIR